MNRNEAKKRARELVSKMTLEEKASQLLYNAPGIERLGIHPYNWWNEALHGVARSDVATVFPQAIGLGATFDPELIREVAEIISTEARAKNNETKKQGDFGIYKNLTFWSPNINIFRDPRWGRGQETYGEDPFLTASVGCSFVKGLQGDGEFLKTAACAKHFAVHSGPEKLRHSFDARCSEKDLFETYLPAFEKLVCEAGVEGVMGAYNRTNGEPCCAHTKLMRDTLFGKWNFAGYFVSDCGAICDFHQGHKITRSGPESAAMAIKANCNINCGNAYTNILTAVREGLITEEDVTRNVERAYVTRFLLGEFEENAPFADIPFDAVDTAESKAKNRETARSSLVLLKNNGILPLKKAELGSVAVIGPNANSVDALRGNYDGYASEYVTVVDGIRSAAPDLRLHYCRGSEVLNNEDRSFCSNAVTAAEHSDVTVLCVGYDATVEGEENNMVNDCIDRGDRLRIDLPEIQKELIRQVGKAAKKLVIVVMSGSAVDLGRDAEESADAIVYAWYPGAQGGNAVADLLFGEYSPSGRLPVTVYRTENTLPDFTDYSMQNRTYRYFREEPMYPFGYGLSYASFRYRNAVVRAADADRITVSVEVTNDSDVSAKEITQVYAKYAKPGLDTPRFQLCGIAANEFAPRETKEITVTVDRYWTKAVSEAGERVDPDTLTLFIGGHQPDPLSDRLCGYRDEEIRMF